MDINMKKITVSWISPTKPKDKVSPRYELDETGGVAQVKTFEDLLEIIGTNGIWNIMVFIIGCYSTFTHPMMSLSYQFVGATPDHWCRVDTLMLANWTQQQVLDLAIPKIGLDEHESCQMYNYNYTQAVNLGYEASMANRDLISEGHEEPIPCYSRDFNYTEYESTIVIEWDLVCERLSLYSTTQAVTQIGFLFGAIIFGYLLDMFGRRRVVLASVVASIICAVMLPLAPDYQLYILLKTLTCFSLIGFYVGCFVILMELCSPSQRSSVGSMFVMPFAFGFMMAPGIAYFIRSWRWLQAAYTLPLFPLLAYFWLLPESPRWLISEHRHEEALKILAWAAKINRRSLPPREALIISMKNIAKESKISTQTTQGEEECKKSFCHLLWKKFSHCFILVTTKDLRKRALICYFCWFSVSMVYYGVALNSTNLSADPYLYVFLGGVVEVPSYILLWPALAYLGRKVSLVSLYLACAFTISIVAIVMYTVEDASIATMMFLSLLGKLSITAAFHLLYVYTAELFPTKYRSLAIGESSMMARLGSIASPYINDLLGNAISWGPSALFAVVSVLAASLALLLPETRDTDLIEDTNTSDKKSNQKENGSLLNEDVEAENK